MNIVPSNRIPDDAWNDTRVTVMGLGRFGGGIGVTRWLAQRGARVTLTDRDSAENLAESLARLTDLSLETHFGGHVEDDFRDTDLVVVNPAVPPTSPFLAIARAAHVPITTEINLFIERCPAKTIAVTGSVGKSTITAMIGHILQHTASPRRVWVGGNIGRSLLDQLPRMSPEDYVVLELSSFQLTWTPLIRWSPRLAVITSITPNHLDWHGDFDAYRDAKLNIARYQDARTDTLVIQNDPELSDCVHHADLPITNAWHYGLAGDVPFAVAPGTDHELRWSDLELDVPGRHNRENAAAALTVSRALGVAPGAARDALATFAALPHRLQRVVVQDGVKYYNDSKSTTPEAAIAAIQALQPPLLLILGGYDKRIDLTPAARVAAERADFSACIGQTGHAFAELIRAHGGNATVCHTLDSAVAACREHAAPGTTVLLSPACASWDQFIDYRARGDAFARLAEQHGAHYPSTPQ